jgi:hypothetical protein
MLAFFKSWQNNGTTLFASIEHSEAIKGPKDFKFTLFIENFCSLTQYSGSAMIKGKNGSFNYP